MEQTSRPHAGKKGNLFIVSAPSGAGKSTLCKAALNHFRDLEYSVSHTTRQPRGNEIDGTDYHFISVEEFEKNIREDKWAEWAKVHGNYYGTSADFLEKTLGSGNDIILDIDVQGAMKLFEKYPDSISIFIMPPSFEVLGARMEGRGEDSKETMELRLKNAAKEMACKHLYKHIIVNNDLDTAIKEIIDIIQTCRKKRNNQ